VSVRIRMKVIGRKHRPFYRICAIDKRAPRGGKVLEELGTYDPMVKETDARALLVADRVDYWLGVGAQPSEKVAVLIKKYGSKGTHVEQQKAALEKAAQPKAIPDPGKPAESKKQKKAEAAIAETSAPAAEPESEPVAAE
jgi:small subunit ribosomal protein S16